MSDKFDENHSFHFDVKQKVSQFARNLDKDYHEVTEHRRNLSDYLDAMDTQKKVLDDELNSALTHNECVSDATEQKVLIR